MEAVLKKDDKGNTIIFKRYCDRTFHKDTFGDVGNQLLKIDSLRCRPDDVLLSTFPKSGSHWIYNTARMIQTYDLKYFGTPEFLEYQDLGVIDAMTSPRMFHTHLSYPFITDAAKKGHLKVIYILRNPKEVACSHFKFLSTIESSSFHGSFDGYLKFFCSEDFCGSGGSWFTHTREWTNAMLDNPQMKILFLRYEDLKENLYQNIVRIAEFLDVNNEETFLRNVEQGVSFDNLKKAHTTSAGETKLWKHLGDNGRMPIYRKGIVGDWKNTFTMAQNEKFHEVFKMRDMNIDLKFVYE